MRFQNRVLAAVTVAVLTAGAANAQFDAYTLPAPRTGNQTNFAGSLGLQFDVISAIQVTELGVFDSGQNGIAGNGLFAQIFERLTGTPVTAPVSFSSADPGALDGAYRFKTISPVLLTAGVSYQIVSWGYGTADPNVNAGFTGGGPAPTTNTGGGLISFGRNRYSTTPGVNPTTLDGNPIPRYGAGNFTFRVPVQPPVNGAPEPGTFALFGLGVLTAVGIVRRRRG